MGEGRTPSATGLLFIDVDWFINSNFFYLPHSLGPINIHEFPALEYLSSWKEEWGRPEEEKERVPGGGSREYSGEDGGLWICLLLSRLPFQAATGKVAKVLGQSGDLPMPIIILPQCLWKNTAHSGGREGVCAIFSALILAPAWKLATLGPPAQEGGGDRLDVPPGKGTLAADQAEGMCGLLPHPVERSES